jgi:hypothetical protein
LSISTVPAAKAKVLELVSAAFVIDAPYTVPCTWSEPLKDEEYKRANCWLGESVEQEEEWKALGAQKKEEVYTFPLVVQVHSKNSTAQPTEEEAWALQAIVTAALRTDNGITLDDTLNLWAEVSASTSRSGPTADGGFLARVTMTVTCRARI